MWTTGDLDTADRLYASDYVNHELRDPDDPGDLLDIEAMKAFATEFRQAFPDFHDSIDLQVAEGDLVATRFTLMGTHRGTFRGIEPTGRKVSWTGVTLDRVANGKIVESWANWDMVRMLQQLGAFDPTPARQGAGHPR